jgi:hypothetical protein
MNKREKISRGMLIALLTLLVHLLLIIALLSLNSEQTAAPSASQNNSYVFFKNNTKETSTETSQLKEEQQLIAPQPELQTAQALSQPQNITRQHLKEQPYITTAKTDEPVTNLAQDSTDTTTLVSSPEWQPARVRKSKKQKPRMTLADITNGFVKSITQEQENHPQTNNRQSLGHQFSMNRYTEKAITAILQSSRANKKKILWTDEMSKAQTCLAQLTIARNGKIIEVKIDPSTGVKELDQLCIETFNEVGWYPPLPKGYEGESYTFAATIAQPERPASGVIYTVHLLRGNKIW